MLSKLHQIAFCRQGNFLNQLLAKFDVQKRKIVIDFSSPNIAKIFHVGNLRSTIYGNYLQKICRSAGHDVVSINYLGDWGQQYSLLAFYWMAVMNGSTSNHKAEWAIGNLDEKMKILTNAYVAANRMATLNPVFFAKVRQLHVRMEKNMLGTLEENLQELPNIDEALKLWEEWVRISREYLEKFYSRFGIQFDYWDCESAHVKEGARLVDELIQQGICRLNEDKSTWVIDNIGPGKAKIALRRGDGANIYLNRELAAIYSRHKRYNADQYIYVVDKNQANHFIHLKQLLKFRGDEGLAERIHHHSYGRVIGLSTREGKNDSVDFLINQGRLEAEAYVDSSFTKKSGCSEKEMLCQKLARSQLVFDLVQRGKDNDFTFSYRGAFTEGTNALKLQEKYSRLNSLELAAQEHMERLQNMSEDELSRMRPEKSENAQKLAKMVTEFDIVLNKSLTKMETSPVTTYLIRLSNTIGRAIPALRVVGEPLNVALPRMLLFSASKKVLEEGMRLVCIDPIERI